MIYIFRNQAYCFWNKVFYLCLYTVKAGRDRDTRARAQIRRKLLIYYRCNSDSLSALRQIVQQYSRNLFKDIHRIIVIKWSSFIMLTIITYSKPLRKTFAFSYTESLFWIRFFLFRVRVFKSQVRVFLNTSPDFFRVRVRVFLESGFS
jgi:hypothetical protein